ncbi:uncharacterized protein [Hetaerina americana]|uniref:uncharacterized protein n=1 Tax=Hetaerina americana TaxID=62018 RepID=UPI003A7F47E4
MMPRKPRRSSILKPPKQVVRAPLQDLDSDDEGTLTQPTSRRVSFSRTSQIKEFDPSIGYMTKWNQSYEESLESIEGDENQPKSTNVFDGLSGVPAQKKFKRKRTSTIQLSLNTSSIEGNGGLCSDFNQPLHQNVGTRASKQPRKSLECFQTEVVEEGDTTLFFDELNLTEPIKCSYSNTNMSTNLTRTMEDTFNYSDTDLCQNKIDIANECSTERGSKSSKNVSKNFNSNNVGIIADILPNKDCTFAGERMENADILINKQGLDNANLRSTKEVNASITQSNEANNIKHKTAVNNSSTIMIANDHDELLPLLSAPEKNTHLDDGEGQLGEYNCLETSMELTIPQIRYEGAIPERNYEEQDVQVTHCAQASNLDPEDIEMTGTWGQILGKRNFVSSSETKNVCANQGGEPSSLTNILVANQGSFKQKVADCTVGSDMELSMTYGGLVVEDNMVNMTLGSDEICADMDGMELTVSLGKVKMSKAIEKENIDSFKPLETPEQLNNPGIILEGKNEVEGLPKEMAGKNSVEDVNSTCYSEGLDETCPAVQGMEMTVSLGKIREKTAKSHDEDVKQTVGGIGDSAPWDQPKNELKLVQIVTEKENHKERCLVDQISDAKLHIRQKSQEMNEARPEAGVMSKTFSLQQSYVDERKNSVDPESGSRMGDTTNPALMGMDVTLPQESKQYVDTVDISRKCNSEVDETNPDVMDMELTVPLKKLKGEMDDFSRNAVTVSQIRDVTCPESMGLGKPLPMQGSRFEENKDSVHEKMSESHVSDFSNPNAGVMQKGEVSEDSIDRNTESRMIDNTSPEATGMELTVPLGRLKGSNHGDLVDNLLGESKIMDETIPDEMGMELTVALGRLKGEKCKDPVDSTLQQTQMVNDTNPEEIGMELTVPLSRLNEGKCKGPADSMILQTQMVNGTIPDEMGMELTVPLGRLKGENCKDPVDSTLQQTQMVNDTNPEEIGMELTVPLSRLNEGKCKGPADSMILQTQMVNGTIPDEMGMELTVALGRLKGEKCKDPVDSTLQQTQMVNDTNPEEIGMELTVPLSRLNEGKCKGPADSMILQTQMVNGTIPDDMGMELTVPLGRLKGGKCKGPVDNMILQTQMVNGTIPDEMGMELTVPLGRLKGEKCKDPVDSILQQAEMVNDDNLDEMGMELTVSLGRLKGVKQIATGCQVLNDMDAKVECMKLASPSASVESHINRNSGNDTAKEQETNNKDFFFGKSKCEDDILQTVNEGQALNKTNTNSNDELMVTPVEEQVCGFIVNNEMAMPISKVGVNMEEEKVKLSISVCGRDEQEGSPISDVLSEFQLRPDTTSKDIPSESNIILRCAEKMTSEVEDKAVEDQRDKITIPEQVCMEQSLSEAIDGKLRAVNIGCTKSQVVNETSIRGDKMMEINTSTERPVKNVRKSPVHNVVQLDSVDIGLTTSEVNKSDAEYDLNSVLSQEKCGQKIEENICEGKLMVSDNLVSNTARLPDERESLEETNVTFNKQVLANTNGTFAEMEVPLDKLKSCAKVGKMAVSLSSQLNADADINRCSPILNENTNQFSLVSSDCIINSGLGAIDSGVVPAMDSVVMPAFENGEHLHDDQAFAPVNRLATASEEVAMDCVPCSEIDSNVDKNCMEPMDMSFKETLEPTGIGSNFEIKAVHQSELDCSSTTDCDENQSAKDLSNMEVEMREGTSSIAADAPESSAVEVALNAPILKPLVSVEDWIKEESSKENCEWSVHKLLENQYSFIVYHGTGLLMVNLKPLPEGQDSRDNRIVQNVMLESLLEDDNEWCVEVVLNVMLNKLTTELLSSQCSSTEQLPSLFEFLTAEFYNMNMLLLQTYDLMRAGPVDYKNDGFTFRVPSMKRLLLFEVQINLLKWDQNGIKPEDVQVKNIIGNMRVTDIQSVIRSVKCDKCYFRNIYNEVLNFIYTLEKVLE